MNNFTKLFALRKISVCLTIIFITFTSCREDSRKNSQGFIISDVSKIQENEVNLSSLIEVKNIVPLETNDSSLIGGNIRKILKHGHLFYVSFDRTTLLCFSEDGTFVRRIGTLGNGRGEYTSLADFDVDNEGIYIVGNRQMNVYKPDGTFQEKISFKDYNLIGINLASDKLLGMVTLAEETSHVFDKKGNLLNKHHPSSPAVWVGLSTYYWPYTKNTYLMQLGAGNDVLLYDVEKDQYAYAHLINLPNVLTLDQQNELDEKDPHHTKGWYTDYATTLWSLNSNGKHLFFVSGNNNENEYVLWLKDLQNNTDRAFRLSHIVNDVSFTPINRFFTSFTRSTQSFLAYIRPDQLKESISLIQQSDSPYYLQMKSLADKLNEEDNLILIEYEFK